MIKMTATAILFLLILTGSISQAGHVVLSCDFKGYQGVADIEIKSSPAGLMVNVYPEGENFRYYSLPFYNPGTLTHIDLSGFNIFNELANPVLKEANGLWLFEFRGTSHQVLCSTLK